MADISNPQIVKWANERARTLADKMTELYAALVAYQNDYTAQGISAAITAAGAANLVGDGSDIDGRVRISGTTLINFKAAVAQLQTSYETAVAGVGSPITTIQNGIQVTGSPR